MIFCDQYCTYKETGRSFRREKVLRIIYEISGNAVLIKEINELEIKIRKLKRKENNRRKRRVENIIAIVYSIYVYKR